MGKRNPLRRTKEQVQRLVGHNDIPIVNALVEETDRGCALAANEFLSDVLEVLFRTVMNRSNASEEQIGTFLLGGFAPLGNFSARISAAYWFGYIGPKTQAALEDVRAIRNQCAHRGGPITLKDSAIQTNVHSLETFVKDLVKYKPNYNWVYDRYFTNKSPFYGKKRFSRQRRTFMKAVFTLHSSIHYCSLISKDGESLTGKYCEPGVWW